MINSTSNNLHNNQMQNSGMNSQYPIHANKNISELMSSVDKVTNNVVEVPTDTVLTPEQQNSLMDFKQTKINEFSVNVESIKQKEKDVALAGMYVDQQKSVVNAYSISANGESVYDTDKEENVSLTEAYVNVYNSLIQNEIQPLSGDLSDKNNDSLSQLPSIQPVNTQSAGQGGSQTQSGVNGGQALPSKMQQYMSTQQPVEHSILHLSA